MKLNFMAWNFLIDIVSDQGSVSDLGTFQIPDSELEILNILMCLDICDATIGSGPILCRS